MTKPTRQKMCVINPAVVQLIAPLVGGQSEIMVRVGISWNSWNKLLEGLPIRCSMAERLRARILGLAENLENFIAAYPAEFGGLDHAAMEADFMRPVVDIVAEPVRHVDCEERVLDLVG
jgi:hypothetical protein